MASHIPMQDASDLLDDLLAQVEPGTYTVLALAREGEDTMKGASFGAVATGGDHLSSADERSAMLAICLARESPIGGYLLLTRLEDNDSTMCWIWKLQGAGTEPLDAEQARTTFLTLPAGAPVVPVVTFGDAMEIIPATED